MYATLMQYTIQTFCPIFFYWSIAKFILIFTLMSVRTYSTAQFAVFLGSLTRKTGRSVVPPLIAAYMLMQRKSAKNPCLEKFQGSVKASSSSTMQLQVALVKPKCSFG